MVKTIKKFMATVVAATVMVSATVASADVRLQGAGATFPAPIYQRWVTEYQTQHPDVKIDYQSIGSGGGIKGITEKTVDFGASDAPMNKKELAAVGGEEKILQIPTVAGAVVIAYNLPDFQGELKLDGPVIADMFLGKITKWNDPAIAKLNPGVQLPATAISVVHRSDGSGTTFIWTNYLSKVSADWKSKVGEGTAVSWPTGVGGKGNEGVASYVQRIDGSIGYVEYAYAKQNKMAFVLVKNRGGEYVAPNAQSFQAAAAGADWKSAPGMYLILTDAAGRGAWPIAGATFILMHKAQQNPANAREVLKFFDWAYTKGDEMAESLDYVPLPNAVVNQIQSSWKSQLKDPTGKPVY
jgi:phosphate transport system substrate-binding protein